MEQLMVFVWDGPKLAVPLFDLLFSQIWGLLSSLLSYIYSKNRSEEKAIWQSVARNLQATEQCLRQAIDRLRCQYLDAFLINSLKRNSFVRGPNINLCVRF